MPERSQETVTIPHPDGGSLHGRLSWPAAPRDWAVVYAHGFGATHQGEKAQALEAACARRDWTYAAFDFRGHGRSNGSLLDLRGSGLLADLETVRAYLAGRGVRRLCLAGSSMGGWAAAWYTLLHPEAVAACVLIAPALHFLRSRWDNLTEDQRRAWRETGRLRIRNQWLEKDVGYSLVEERDQYPAGRLAAELARPVLIFHGMRDDTVPYTLSLALAELAVCPHLELRLLKDGDHRLSGHKEIVAEEACAFLARWVEVGWA
jgi:pimeloyl-ACP methyl ester carboxylesterase